MASACSQFHSQLLPTILPVLLLATFILAKEQPPIARLGCRDKYGNINIPFPFGVGVGCFLDYRFEVYCNDTRAFLVVTDTTYQKMGEANIFNASRPFKFNESAIPPSPIELIEISAARNKARVYGAVSSYCSKFIGEQVLKLQLTTVGPSRTSMTRITLPINLSMKRNVFIGVGASVDEPAKIYSP